jgi:predicted nicotinamide N-methyase
MGEVPKSSVTLWTFTRKRKTVVKCFEQGSMSLTPDIARSVVNTLSCWQPLRRLERMRSIAQRRRLDIELVLENIVDDSNAVGDLSLQVDVFHGHINASLQAACIRTADALGIQVGTVAVCLRWWLP